MRIGSTSSDENTTIAEIYAAALEHANIPVVRHMRVGNERTAMLALRSGEIELYPGRLRARTSQRGPDPAAHDGITSLPASPANDSPCLVTSQYAAEQFWLLRLTKCAMIAPKLRLAATRDFIEPGGTLEQLRKRYGGFHFTDIVECRDGEQFYALNRGDADVANGFTTDPNIAQTQLIVLSDDKHFWPEEHIAPFVRIATLRARPHLAAALNPVSARLTLYTLQKLNARQRVLNMDSRDVADEFVSETSRRLH